MTSAPSYLACMCGAREDTVEPRPAPRACWHCGDADGMRAVPWKPTDQEVSRYGQ